MFYPRIQVQHQQILDSLTKIEMHDSCITAETQDAGEVLHEKPVSELSPDVPILPPFIMISFSFSILKNHSVSK